MPTATLGGALLNLYHEGVWEYPVWQETTGCILDFDRLDRAMFPKGWSQEDIIQIKSYASQHKAQRTDEAKNAFAAAKSTLLPGRKLWNAWITDMWRRAQIHLKIAKCMADNNCHPSNFFDEEDHASAGSMYVPICLDDIGMKLFGYESLDRNDHLKKVLRPSTQAIALKTWTNLSKNLKRSQTRFDKQEEKVLAAFEGKHPLLSSYHHLNKNKLTKPKITAVIRSVGRWRNLAEILMLPQNLEKVENMQGELERLLEELGAQLPEKTKKEKALSAPLFSLSDEQKKLLASPDKVQSFVDAYREHFDDQTNVADDIPVLEQYEGIANAYAQAVDGEDTGVDLEAHLKITQLSANLGFPGNRPLLFNKYRANDGLNAWSNPEVFDRNNKGNDANLSDLYLFWHQLAGVHAVIRCCMTKEKMPSQCTGVLICDEVGLGKTYMSAAIMAFFIDLVIRQQTDGCKSFPGIFAQRPYLRGEDKIPNQPNLILAPGTLISQWLDELRILFSPGSVDILVYPTSQEERRKFWSPEGLFAAASRNFLSRIIILASHTTMHSDEETDGASLGPPRSEYSDAPMASELEEKQPSTPPRDSTLGKRGNDLRSPQAPQPAATRRRRPAPDNDDMDVVNDDEENYLPAVFDGMVFDHELGLPMHLTQKHHAQQHGPSVGVSRLRLPEHNAQPTRSFFSGPPIPSESSHEPLRPRAEPHKYAPSSSGKLGRKANTARAPAHRQPESFGGRGLSPPRPLAAKKTKPFSRK